jgi:Zn-dependent peptidase ImmA (M78 family)
MSVNIEKAKELIINRACQLVNELINRRSHDNPPFLPEEYASLLGVKSIEKTVLGKIGEKGGLLLRFHNGPRIIINKNDPLVRQNFSCAHELGHLLFSELKLAKYTNTVEHRTFNPQVLQRNRAKAIEKLCDAAATELLMPELIFKKYLINYGISINSIIQLANIFNVSIQTSAIRISELSPIPCVTLKWQLLNNKSKSLKLSWPKIKAIGNINCTPVNKRINPPSKLHEAYYNESIVRCYRKFKVNNIIKNLMVESKGFGRGENRCVISLAFLEE